MNTQLNYMVAERRSAELQRAGERARLAREGARGMAKLPHRNLITPLSAHRGRRSPRTVIVLEIKPDRIAPGSDGNLSSRTAMARRHGVPVAVLGRDEVPQLP